MAEPTSSKAENLAQYFIETRPEGSTKSSPSLVAQIEHRIKLVSFWSIIPGSRVLEIGCGQGDCTIALADAVGENGHVDAVDPGAPDYGMLSIYGEIHMIFLLRLISLLLLRNCFYILLYLYQFISFLKTYHRTLLPRRPIHPLPSTIAYQRLPPRSPHHLLQYHSSVILNILHRRWI